MFGQKITREGVMRAFGNAKKFLGHTYHQTKNVLGHLDHGVAVAKKVYSVLQPVIESLGGNGSHKHVMKALGGYENIRDKVIDTHENAMNTYGRLKRGVPELGLR